MTSNVDRAKAAYGGLAAYAALKNGSHDPVEDADTLVDLLTDLRHWCAGDIDFDRAVRLSADHFDAERPDEFVVIENTPGYLPEDDDPPTFAEYADAVAYMNERVAEYVEQLEDDLEGENEGHTVDVNEGCASSANYSATYVTTTRPHDLGRWFAVENLEQ